MRAGGAVSPEERADAAADAAAAELDAAARGARERWEAAEALARAVAEREGDGSAAAAAARRAASAAEGVAGAALAAADRAANAAAALERSRPPSPDDTAAPGSESSPRDARRYLAYLRALDGGFRGEYLEWLLLSAEGKGGTESTTADGGEAEGAAAALGGLAASLLTTTPAPKRYGAGGAAAPAAERPVPKGGGPPAPSLDASPANAAAWAAGRCLALAEGGAAGFAEAPGGDFNRSDVLAFLNIGPLLSALEGMGVSNARVEVEAAGGPPGAAPLPRVKAYAPPEVPFFKRGERPPMRPPFGVEDEEPEGELHPSEARTCVELPVADGSALQWAAEIASVGLVTAPPPPPSSSASSSSSETGEWTPASAPAPRSFIRVASPFPGGGFVSLHPEPEAAGEGSASSPSSAAAASSSPYSPPPLSSAAPPPPFSSSTSCRVSVGVDGGAEAPVVGSQWLSWSPSPGVGPGGAAHYRFSLAPARDWLPSAERLLELRATRRLYRAGTAGTTLVARGRRWADERRCRFVPDEPARQAAAAAVGALALLSGAGGVGVPRNAHVVAFNADAATWVEFVRAVEAEGSGRVALE
jgi:hypothetical protein